jgi:DNA polymerase-3 subunit delta'
LPNDGFATGSFVSNPINSTQTGIRPPFDQIYAQPTAARFLTAALDAVYNPQAYLFFGPVGSGKSEASLLLAKALLCPTGGADMCEDCQRLSRHSHPDLHILQPEGTLGYLIEQMTDLIRDVSLAPIRAERKLYIVTQADRMSISFANAFLKVLEEPPASVVFVLLARSQDAVLPTIRSRCQAVPFAAIPEDLALARLVVQPATSQEQARLALAVSSGSLTEALVYLQSDSLQKLRHHLMGHLRGLARYDALDILTAARELVINCKLPLDELYISQERQISEAKESISRSAMTTLVERHKRELTAAERNSARWLIHCLASWLRDILLVSQQPTAAIANYDELDVIKYYALQSQQPGNQADNGLLPRLLICISATTEAEGYLDYNVSVQSIFEYLLFTLRQELGEHPPSNSSHAP